MTQAFRITLAIPFVLLSAAGVAAQEAVEEADLPQEVADEIISFLNDPATIRFNGRSSVPAGSQITGDVAVLAGPFEVAGTIRGDLVVVNGDLTLSEGGRVQGDVTVIGGRVESLADGAVTGTLTVFDEPLQYAMRGGEIRLRGGPRTERRGIYLGDSRLTVRAGTNYNRIEGLPVLFGPVFQTSGSNPLRMEALATARTESGSTRDDLGYQIRLEQQIGVPAAFTFGIGAHSEVVPIERWGLRDLEASLATFFLHADYRDYYERQGFSLFASTRVPSSPVEVELEYRNEEHLEVPVASPWTLRRNDKPWRAQPLVPEGDLQILTLSAVVDQRNDPEDPTDGWWASGRLIRGLDGTLRRRAYLDPELEPPGGGPGPVDISAEDVSGTFSAGFLDLRRYARVGPDSDLALRMVVGGSLDRSPLPAQFQHALGGEGSLPGYRVFSQDCGARSRLMQVEVGEAPGGGVRTEPAFAWYGCDRFALFQAEYRGHFSWEIGLDPENDDWESWDWYPAIDLSPSWTVFFNAGRGWSSRDDGVDFDTVADIGVGVFLGDLGFHWAYPLSGDDRTVNFFVRLQRRF